VTVAVITADGLLTAGVRLRLLPPLSAYWPQCREARQLIEDINLFTALPELPDRMTTEALPEALVAFIPFIDHPDHRLHEAWLKWDGNHKPRRRR
jgi:hypothetical protein